MRKSLLPLLCFALSVSATIAASPSGTGRFVIDALYRGFVHKTFPAIGSAGFACSTQAGGGFRVTGAGRLMHPQDNSKIFKISLDMQFHLQGFAVEYVASNNTWSRGSEDMRDAVERILPFVYLVQQLPVRPAGNAQSVTTPRGAFTLVYGGNASKPQVEIRAGAVPIGKFFLAMDGSASRIERFRVTGKDSVSLQFNAALQTAGAD